MQSAVRGRRGLPESDSNFTTHVLLARRHERRDLHHMRVLTLGKCSTVSIEHDGQLLHTKVIRPLARPAQSLCGAIRNDLRRNMGFLGKCYHRPDHGALRPWGVYNRIYFFYRISSCLFCVVRERLLGNVEKSLPECKEMLTRRAFLKR